MAASVVAPLGGIAADLGGRSRPLVLTNAEIERFESQYAPFGYFELMGQLLGRGAPPQVRHCRDIVALGLIGGGMGSGEADRIISEMPPSANIEIRSIAYELVVASFAGIGGKKKVAVGSPRKTAKSTGTSPTKSSKASEPV
jgi:hypothetical protein